MMAKGYIVDALALCGSLSLLSARKVSRLRVNQITQKQVRLFAKSACVLALGPLFRFPNLKLDFFQLLSFNLCRVPPAHSMYISKRSTIMKARRNLFYIFILA